MKVDLNKNSVTMMPVCDNCGHVIEGLSVSSHVTEHPGPVSGVRALSKDIIFSPHKCPNCGMIIKSVNCYCIFEKYK